MIGAFCSRLEIVNFEKIIFQYYSAASPLAPAAIPVMV